MSYKVYIFDKAINITDNLNESSQNLYAYNSVNLDDIIFKLQSDALPEVFLYHPNLDEAWQNFQKHFDVIEAAGGIVENAEHKYLFIYRNDKWDLPKGKMEPGELPDETAIREVKEECGIQNIEIDHFLLDTYHLFTENNKKRLKITHWYKMNELEKSPLKPQIEEGIEKVAWLDIASNDLPLNNSYENIKLLFSDLERLKKP
jgi:8-oxo-dGTP pyrophosphatase MutT (NUDIX family)